MQNTIVTHVAIQLLRRDLKGIQMISSERERRANHMNKHIETGTTVTSTDSPGLCSNLLDFFQIAVGVLLMIASAFGYSLFQHAAVLLPSLMGAALLYHGARASLVCRKHSTFHNQHPTAG